MNKYLSILGSLFMIGSTFPRDVKGHAEFLADQYGLVAYIMAGIVGAVMLVIGPVVAFSARNAISQTGWTASQNTTMTNLDSNIQAAWNIAGISLLVVFAAGIINTLKGAF